MIVDGEKVRIWNEVIVVSGLSKFKKTTINLS
jgi:hypothetical protein